MRETIERFPGGKYIVADWNGKSYFQLFKIEAKGNVTTLFDNKTSTNFESS